MLNIRNLHLYKLNISFITFLYFFFYHYISFIIISFSSLNSIYLSIKINKLSFIVNFLKFNSYFKSTSLMDITVVDYPENTANRFEVSYVLLNYKYNFRFIIRLYTNGITPIASLTNIFNSSN